MNKTTFKARIDEVIEMNKIFRDKINFGDRQLINAQMDFVREEVKETIERGLEAKDKKEFIDGIADVFVTASFLEYLYHDPLNFEEEFENQLQSEIVINKGNLKDILGYIVNEKKGSILRLLKSILDYIDSETGYFDENGMTLCEKAILAVNESNMSKFPLLSETSKEQIERDIDFIKKSKNIDDVTVIIKNGRITYINPAINKFQKPSTFKEPDLDFVNEIEALNKILN